ncbi:MAG TPA: FG-GAP-like repeat-containing protein [Thermoanaerobaculia bacterium]|nr:FG-GAP-like repeat-containing protein [Thermoanaerobaculia bacterium]
MVRVLVCLLLLGVTLFGGPAASAECAQLASNFDPAQPIGNFYTAFDFALADFNRDEIVDAAAIAGGRLTIAMGTPFGSFQASASYATAGGSLSVAAADFNGDGWPDVAVTTQKQFLQIFMNRGDATFTQSDRATTFFTRAVRTADVNRDGIPDLVVAGSADVVGAFISNGDGTFRAMPAAVGTNDTRFLAVADFNGDGLVDAAVAGGVLLGNGEGSFATAIPFLPAPAAPSTPFAAGDLNGDGRADIVAGDAAGVSIYLAGANGTMEKAASVGRQAGGIAIGDIDRDGTPDVILSRSAIIHAGPGGDWTAPVVAEGMPLSPFIALADRNGDGVPDLISASQRLQVYFNRCGGSVGSLMSSHLSSFAGREIVFEYLHSSSEGTVTFRAGDMVLGVDADFMFPYRLTTAFAHPGDYVVTAVHHESGSEDDTAAMRFRVYSGPSTLSIDASAVRADTDSMWRVRVDGPPDSPAYGASSGEVTLVFNGVPYGFKAPVSGGVATFPAINGSAGTWHVRAIYSGGTLWPPGETEVTITIEPKRPKSRAVRK